MRSPILPEKCTNLLKRLIKQGEIRFSLQDSKRPKGLRLFDFFPNEKEQNRDEWTVGVMDHLTDRETANSVVATVIMYK